MPRELSKLDSSFVLDQNVTHYCAQPPFDPPTSYPELRGLDSFDPLNNVYPMVRTVLWKLGLDKERYGSPEWNPLGDIIEPGNHVLIKPNLVTHRHLLGEDALLSSIVHGSVLRPLVDYASKALKGEGRITIADNPVEGADFSTIMRITGIDAMVAELRNRGQEGLQLLDLRPQVVKEDENGSFYYEKQEGDPLGYLEIDLGSDSMFSEFDLNNNVHYYTLADPTVDHLEPRFRGKSKTDEYHKPGSHRYLVSKTVLSSDVIINVSKLKTHCKAGATLSMKNMVGMVYQKDCMPHHRPGMPPEGDAFPFYPAHYYVAARKLYSRLRGIMRIHNFPGFVTFRNWLQRKKILVGQHLEHGNWKGNDTIWRTIVDLNRIALYADKDGKMLDSPTRRFLGLIDGIVAQEGEGPINGDPKQEGILLGGGNPVTLDAMGLGVIGIRTETVKSIAACTRTMKWPLLPGKSPDLSEIASQVPCLKFKLPKGWV